MDMKIETLRNHLSAEWFDDDDDDDDGGGRDHDADDDHDDYEVLASIIEARCQNMGCLLSKFWKHPGAIAAVQFRCRVPAAINRLKTHCAADHSRCLLLNLLAAISRKKIVFCLWLGILLLFRLLLRDIR